MKITQSHNRQEWLELRRKGIGASDAYCICGYGFKSPLEIFYSKTQGVQVETKSSLVELGNYFEPAILQWLSDTLQCPVKHNSEHEIVWSDKTPFMCCSLDGTIDTSNSDLPVKNKRIPVEVKFSQWDDDFDDMKYPDKYEIQMQHQMYVTESSIMILVACVKNKFVYWWVERNDKLIDKIIAINTEFWQRVQNNDPPLAQNGDKDILRLIYPNLNKKAIELSPELKTEVKKISELKETIKKGKNAEKEFEGIKARVEQELAGNDTATINNVPMFVVEEMERKGFTVEPSKYKQVKYLGD